jgi:hypothetical protein
MTLVLPLIRDVVRLVFSIQSVINNQFVAVSVSASSSWRTSLTSIVTAVYTQYDTR